VLGRWGAPDEAASDGARLTDLVALSAAAAWLAAGPLDKRLLRLLQGLHLQVESVAVSGSRTRVASCCSEVDTAPMLLGFCGCCTLVVSGHAGALAQHL
jgi:hypothetical protein